MNIATYGPFVAGGLLIGLAAGLLLLGSGRIAGISGLAGRLLDQAVDRRLDVVALLFTLGLLASPWIAALLGLQLEEVADPNSHLPKLVAAGLLVGIGTQLGGGCTSGHGVCGMANLSPRGLVATLVFMGVAALVVALGFGGVS